MWSYFFRSPRYSTTPEQAASNFRLDMNRSATFGGSNSDRFARSRNWRRPWRPSAKRHLQRDAGDLPGLGINRLHLLTGDVLARRVLARVARALRARPGYRPSDTRCLRWSAYEQCHRGRPATLPATSRLLREMIDHLRDSLVRYMRPNQPGHCSSKSQTQHISQHVKRE